MIKLRTLLLLFPFFVLVGCSEDEENAPIYNSDPIAAECKMASYTYVESFDSADVNFLRYENQKMYSYNNELLESYLDKINYSFLDTTGTRQEIANSLEYQFEYQNSELTSISIADEEYVRVKNVDGFVYSISLKATDGSFIEFLVGYDEEQRLKYIYSKEDENENIETINHYEFTYDDKDNVLEFSLVDSDGLAALINDFKYNAVMKNPSQGLVFYIISILESSFDSDGFFFGDASKLSPIVDEFYRVSIYNFSTEKYDRSQYIQGDFSEDMNYELNDKDYPISGNMTFNYTESIVVSINETFAYTNCN